MGVVKLVYQIKIIKIRFTNTIGTIWLQATVFKPETVDKIKKAPLTRINGAF